MLALWQILMLAMIVGVTAIHANRFKCNIPITWTFHIFWALPFAGYIYFIFTRNHDWYIVCALALERLVTYNIILNKFRNLPFFYIGSQTKNEAWTDKIIELWKGSYPYIWAVASIGWIAVNVLMVFKVLK